MDEKLGLPPAPVKRPRDGGCTLALNGDGKSLVRIYAGSRRWREGVDALRNRTPEQRERERVAMADAIAAVTADGKRLGEAIAARRAAPCVPGRIRSRITVPVPRAVDPLVEAVVEAFPGLRLVPAIRQAGAVDGPDATLSANGAWRDA